MSLINQLLKDLEKSPRSHTSPEKLLSGLRADISHELKKKKKYYFLITFLVLVLISVLSISALSKKHKQNLSTALNNKTLLSNPSVINTASKNNAVPTVTNTDSMLTGIALQMQQDMTYLRFLLNHNTLYEITSDTTRHEFTIVFENTRLVAALPKINYAGSGVEDIQAFKDENGNLKLVLRLNSNADIKRLDLNEDGKEPELQLDIYYNNPSELVENHSRSVLTHTMPVTIKNPVAENISEQEYQRATQLVAAGQNTEGIEILKRILVATPTDRKTREYLLPLLIQQGDKAEAYKILDIGLNLQPGNPTFIKLKARLLVDEGKVDLALALLQKFSPEITTDPEYYAFIAALYQRQGQAHLAADLYKKLVGMQPANAKWWVGLGIALEASGDRTQAFDAYSNADGIGGLNPELKTYLNTRLHTT
jgi:Flp pilus assembly protein TadD